MEFNLEKFVDPKGQVFERPHLAEPDWRISGYAMVLHERKILLVEPFWNSQWEFPGGGIEIGESIPQGVVRECRDETGLGVELLSDVPFYLGEGSFFNAGGYFHSVIMVFLAAVTAPDGYAEPRPPQNGEIRRAAWLDFRELNAGQCHRIIWPAIQKLRKKIF